MRALWDGMRQTLAADDLFWRVSCFLFALLALAIASLIGWLLLSPARESMGWLWQALIWLLTAASFGWAAVLLAGCFAPPESRPTRWAAVALPSIVDFEGEMSLLSIVTFFPAAVLTLLLRAIGLRGCQSPQSALLIEEAEENTRSPWP